MVKAIYIREHRLIEDIPAIRYWMDGSAISSNSPTRFSHPTWECVPITDSRGAFSHFHDLADKAFWPFGLFEPVFL
ncbi:predicted protein [Methanosarcina acetivorans C2A]|uniref:Uncharacterized protein n=1 Tax=Methanosarcina acetivorans (strain ATCC 35395 / DSM 2834 / JCM 12185 / C2A) TaxID=188937 RepID=Q8TJW8_METAC|nr:predicted protein [Methanosarcina acetivorans C2A]